MHACLKSIFSKSGTDLNGINSYQYGPSLPYVGMRMSLIFDPLLLLKFSIINKKLIQSLHFWFMRYGALGFLDFSFTGADAFDSVDRSSPYFLPRWKELNGFISAFSHKNLTS